MSRWKKKRPPKDKMRITKLTMSDGRIVDDPAEVVRLLRADGFIVDELTGAVTVGPRLQKQ